MQSKLESFLESLGDVAIGFAISMLLMQFVINPLFLNVNVSSAENFGITLIFTVSSILRKYGVRRLANWWTLRKLKARDTYNT